MRALALTGTGGLEHLVFLDVPKPELIGPHDVRVRIRAAALNHLDLFVADGLPGVQYEFPRIVGCDGAGIVDAVGAAVTSVRPGDAVLINPGLSCDQCPQCLAGEHSQCNNFAVLGEHRDGTIAEYVVVPEVNLARKPAAMSWPIAAAFSLSTLTAWRMLVTRARLQAGETVLIWGIGGGVALSSLQIALHLGARAIVTSGSEEKLQVAREMGAAVTVNHTTGDVVAAVREATGRAGADVIVDSVGEATWPRSLRVIKRGGRLVVCGATSGPMVGLDARKLFWHHWSILGSTMGNREEYALIVRLAHEGKLWPRVDRTVSLDKAVSAFQRLESGSQQGKVVIEVSRE